MFFDARAAKLLQPGAHLVVDGCPGLRLEASASRRTWTYRYKAADGRMKQQRLGQWPAMALPAAVAAWQALRDARAQGVDPVAQRKAERASAALARAGHGTVRALVQAYINDHILPTRAPAGAVAAQRALHALLDAHPAFAAMAPRDVSRTLAYDLLAGMRDRPTMAAKLRSLLGAAWEQAQDAGRLDAEASNWWRLVLRGKLKSKGKVMAGQHVGQQRRVLSVDEVAALLHWLPHMHQLAQDCVVMHLWTVTRGAEFLAMRPEHVAQERDGWWWTVPKALTKNARKAEAVDLRVPLFGRALAVVLRRLQAVGPAGWLFATADGSRYLQKEFSTYIYDLQPYSAKMARRQADEAAGARPMLPVVNWSPHKLRATARTLLASLGCSNEVGEAIVGHLPGEMVATYNAYTYDKERRVWLGRLSEYLEGLAR